MPQRAWSDKRERQYEHIKEGLESQGRSEDTAEEIAARTVNKERARAGEARTSSKSSTDDISSGRRGGGVRPRDRAGRSGAGPTRRSTCWSQQPACMLTTPQVSHSILQATFG